MKHLIFLTITFLLISCEKNPHSTSTNASTCTVIKNSVHDGDTIRVNCAGKQQRIRLACIDAPEINQENGIVSRNHLKSLLNQANNQVNIKAINNDRFGRIVAEVYANSQLVQLEQVKNGMVWINDQFKSNCPSWNKIEKAFKTTRSNRKGIFKGTPIPPWEWRQQNR